MCWCGGGFGSKMKACILMVLLLAVSCRAQLTMDEKQLILDLHNYYRATASAANMQRLDWSVTLADWAQEVAEKCEIVKERGVNLFHNTSLLPFDTIQAAIQVVEPWRSTNELAPQPVLWHRTAMLGCGKAKCPRLPLENGDKVFNTLFYVCKYTPTFFSRDDGILYREGACSDSTCPDSTSCSVYSGRADVAGGEPVSTGSYCGVGDGNPVVPTGAAPPVVVRGMHTVEPREGSLAGGTNIIITGTGFSNNQYEGGNRVTFMSISGNLTCDVISYRSSMNQIECVTREAPVKDRNAVYTVVVSSNDGGGFEEIPSCGSCTFTYQTTNSLATPLLQTLRPLASPPNSPVIFGGRFLATGFQDADDSDDPNSPDRDDESDDFFTRILIGGRSCNHMKEDGTLYHSSITENGLFTSIQCNPDTAGLIESHNASVILAKRGQAYVQPADLLMGLDNKLRPYHFQTYADILEVTPRNGSRMGGTRISITMSDPLVQYADSVTVSVGGMPCTDIEVSANVSGYGVIECTTSPQPPSSTYYPGGRGCLREVWPGTDVDELQNGPRSDTTSIQERLFRISTLSIPEFDEEFSFSQRFSGFFVPPKSSLYTFNLRSDDFGRFYLSPNSSSQFAERIIRYNRHTRFRWDLFSSQYSEPVYLVAGQHYYFEALSNQGGGPWDVGLGVKLHDSTLSGGLYDSDFELQRIEISSTIIQEQHALSLEAEPLVQRVTFATAAAGEGAEDEVGEIGSCTLTVDVVRASAVLSTVTLPPFQDAEQLQELLISAIAEYSEVGVQIAVKMRGSEGLNSTIYDIVYLTPLGVAAGEVVTLDTCSSGECSSYCTEENTEIRHNITVRVTTLQDPSAPSSFQVAFNTSGQQLRNTGQLPLDATNEMLRSELTELLSWECTEEQGIDAKTLFYEDYESTGDNSTSYCGAYSRENPYIWWQAEYSLDSAPYICFAYRGVYPNLFVEARYRVLESNPDDPTVLVREGSRRFTLRTQDCSNWPFTGSIDSFGWTEHACINVRECINEQLPSTEFITYDQHTVTRIFFNWRRNFYVDNLAIARTPIQVTQIDGAFPARPNGVSISHVNVEGGALAVPYLTSYPNEMGSTEMDHSPYTMVVSRFELNYVAIDCGFGIGVLIGTYDSEAGSYVKVEQLQAASRPVSGKFDIAIGNKSLMEIDADVTASNLRELMNLAFPNEGGFSVTRGGSCTGYRWDVGWDTKPGDQPNMLVYGDDLEGADVQIAVEARTDGGLWIRPLRGDMMRLPETEPQVDVSVNGIPSSCTSKSCSFAFSSEVTPTITSLSPEEGQVGSEVTIRGVGFSNYTDDISVWIGGVACEVTYASEEEVQCTAGRQSAGCYKIIMMIAEVGLTAIEDSELCFQYLLSVSTISPTVGGVTGGHVITLTGEGFLPFAPAPQEELRMLEYSILPWFRYGLGVPVGSEFDFSETMMAMEYMNHSSFDLSDRLRYLYSQFPSSVFIGEQPCIIVESSVTSLTCVPLLSQSGTFNISVTVHDQNITLSDAYTASIAATPSVDIISPSNGPVTGDINITMSLTANNVMQDLDDVLVMIGSAPCYVQIYNLGEIECTISRHPPGPVPVLISTSAGIAVPGSVLRDWDNVERSHDLDDTIFPTFTYDLRVTEVSSTGGSVFGGTEVSVSGGIFVYGETEVFVSGVEAMVTSVTASEATFITPSLVKNYLVELSAEPVVSDLRVGYRLRWNEINIQIPVGDSVTWNWELDLPVAQSLELIIREVNPTDPNSDVIVDKVGGFSNQGLESEIFSLTFDQVGVHYILTTNNFNTERILSRVNVTEPETIQASIEVFVGGFQARYMPEEGSGGSAMETSPLMPRMRRATEDSARLMPDAEECINMTDVGTSNEGLPAFSYSPCLTPFIFSVMEQTGTRLESIFTISGDLFSEFPAANMVSFGGVPCIVETSTITELTCRLDSSMDFTPPALTLLPVVFRIADLGNAYILSPSESTVTLFPLVREIIPSQGSTAGGTDITIVGDTFSFVQESVTVSIGGVPCEISYVSYSSITCRTGSNQGSEISSNLVIRYMLNGVSREEVVCSNSTNDCSFSYSADSTPVVSEFSPSTISQQGSTEIVITGGGFSSSPDDHLVYFDEIPCPVSEANDTTLVCELPPLAAGSYSFRMSICTNGTCFGNALTSQTLSLTVESKVTAISPENGSVAGGTALIISGYGFEEDSSFIRVFLGSSSCEVLQVTQDSISCVTSPGSLGSMQISVTNDDVSISVIDGLMYEFTMDATPTVTDISPTSGQAGDNVTLTGTQFRSDPNDIRILIGGEPCDPQQIANEIEIVCVLGVGFAGESDIQLTVTSLGSAMIGEGVAFTYTLMVGSLSSTSGSIVGENALTVSGLGFDPSDTTIRICQRLCIPTSTVPSVREIECLVPAASDDLTTVADTISCDVTVESVGMTVTAAEMYVYRKDLTPEVTAINDTRGGTEGGTPLLITGTGFDGPVTVTIAGSPCIVSSSTASMIVCVTERSGRTVREKVMVFVEGKGFAISNSHFWYVDLWSSPFTWGGATPPTEGEFVVIPQGQTLLLDVKTPVLGYLLIQGGQLIFDPKKGDNEVELHTQGALITSGGRMEVGTSERPYMAKTQIVLYGHVLSTEIPVYGAKTLALREGEIDFHGRPMNVTWTRLAVTAEAGATQLMLQDYVEWEVGGKVVIASTSFSQRENEEMEIAAVEPGELGSIITLTSPLEYEHISAQQTIAGRLVETRGEVGYLTRNIVVRGNVNEEWEMMVENCPEEFRPGQFEVQTCFQGRFGAEIVGDQFGSQIMIHAPEKNQDLVTARIEYIEVTHAGQAFRLGRYPIHFHLNGNVTGSYVRGCGIHHTFNRAVTIHTVNHLLVEKNVAYNILGHAYFTEDGIEEYNIIQDNLGVFVRASSSLLNVDITPATFWLVNANNIVRRNAAAGGTHFGFWYRLPEHPTGPSFTTDLCPRKQRVLEFADNTAHSFGWYGLWVFRHYYPTPTGECNDNGHAPSYFDDFLSWRNDRGVEFADTGALQLRNSLMIDNKLAGVEVTEIDSIWDEENGPLISNTLIVGYSGISDEEFCTESGIKTPKSYYLSVVGVTFANFDRSGCYPLQACSHCKPTQGGFETRYRNISFVNAGDRLTRWQWEHEHVHRDLDGTLTGSDTGKVLVPASKIYDQSKCSFHPSSSDGAMGNGTMGHLCDGDMQFGRIGIFNPTPSSLEFTAINITTTHGISHRPYFFKRLRGGPGYMALLPLNQTYNLVWLEGLFFTNISYSSVTSGLEASDYFIMRQQYFMALDFSQIGGVTTATNASVLENPSTAEHGDFTISDNNTLSYILKGGNAVDRGSTFTTFRCFYVDCIPPPPPTLPPPIPSGRPENVMMWSNASIWPNQTLPTEGANVTITRDMYVILDVPEVPRLGRVLIEGGMEVFDDMDRTIQADLIIINGGRFVAGYPDTPFMHHLRIVLHGNQNTNEVSGFEFGTPNIGAKAIAVFGELILNSEPQTSKPWTLLSETVEPGATQLTTIDTVDWRTGDLVVVTSTSYDAFETEVFEVVSVQQNVVTLNDSFRYTHVGEQETIGSVSYTLRAEVGRLSRRITIENGNQDLANETAFGCRVLVTSSGDFRGSVQLQGVEFKGCGQLGYTDEFDPRFALAIVNTGRQQETSYIKECSFHDGYNTAIGLFGTDGLEITDNIVHGTVGPSMIITGADHMVLRNLASQSQFIGTYRDRDEPFNALWTANYEIAGTSRIQFTHNHAAGGGKAGIHSDGEECSDSSSVTIRHNVAHSSLHCFHLGYSDGITECSRFVNVTAYSCYHYGFFSFSRSGVELQDSTFINNKAGIYVGVNAPLALSHQVGTKSVRVERTQIISAGRTFECGDDDKVPEIAKHMRSHHGIRPPSGGHVGIAIPTFASSGGGFPKFPWHALHSYPAISGITIINDVAFANFAGRCTGRKDRALMTSELSEDANHPVHLSSITFASDDRYTVNGMIIQPEFKTFIHEPILSSVNPSDCVDMDCDGYKHMVIRDLDGSFTQEDSPRSLVSQAEFEWDGDRRRGIGDFRIPKTMLTRADGSRIPVEDIYPSKGIVRGTSFGDESQCEYNADWRLYECSNLSHLMLVLESLDEDTEVRRLSPIGIGANGFIDLLNGPMDNGWCGGYTCQERISTFYSIVAASFTYTIGLTSTNPQEFAFHLLNSGEDEGIVVRVIYNNPQRLDVYITNNGEDVYVPPKNAELLSDGNLAYRDSDDVERDFFSVLTDPAGTNFYDRSLKQLHINIKGSVPHKIITTPIIMLSLTVSTTVENFFDEEFLVRNLALLLGIPDNKIRIVNVVRETSSRRRKRQEDEVVMETIEIEIGDPPAPVIRAPVNMTDDMGINVTDTTNVTDMAINTTDTLSIDQLNELTEMVAAVVQTGEILSGSNITADSIVSADISEPVAPPVDPTEGVRATPSTGGLQPEDVGNDTSIPTFFEQQQMMEELAANKSTPLFRLSIPSQLTVTRHVQQAQEGRPVPYREASRLTMLDNNNDVSENLGVGMPWMLTVRIVAGPDGSFLTNTTVDFENGHAVFEGLIFSHPGEYRLQFYVSFPASANFSIMSQTITVVQRSLHLSVAQQPQDGNTTFVLFPYPSVRLFEGDAFVRDHTWRNLSWYVVAQLKREGSRETVGSWKSALVMGEAVFREIQVQTKGDYVIELVAETVPEISSDQLPRRVTTETFSISSPQFTRFIITYDVDYDTIVNNGEAAFTADFKALFVSKYPDSELYGTNVTRGSVIVTTFVTARSTERLIEIIDSVVSDPNTTLTFTFNGVILIPSSVEQDPAYPVSLENHVHLILILVTTIPAGVILLCGLILICMVCCCLSKKRTRQEYKNKVSAGEKHPEGYASYNPAALDRVSVASSKEYFLQTHEDPEVAEDTHNTRHSAPKKLREVVSSSEVKVSVFNDYVTFNPSLKDQDEEEDSSSGQKDLGSLL